MLAMAAGLGAQSGCGDSDAAAGTSHASGPNAAGGDADLTRATPYQTIPPPLVPADFAVATQPGPLHWKPSADPAAAVVWVDVRTAEACVAERVFGSRRINAMEWLGATDEFKCSAAWWQQRRLMAKDHPQPVLLLGDNDRQCAPAWLMLQLGGQPAPLIVWKGLAGITAAGVPTVKATPEAADDQTQIDAYGTEVPPAPPWLVETDEFVRLTAALSPVSGVPMAPAKPTDASTPSTPASPAPATPPPAPAPGPVDTAAAGTASGTAGASAAPTEPPAPVYVYCGSREEWDGDAQQDLLLRGMVRVPPGELYGETTGMLLKPEVILSRVKQVKLEPNGYYILCGHDSEAICAVYMALMSVGFKNVRVYFR
ncbi:MAG TPA: hypothetical protein VL860_12720 [Planctomycetota bacterium]|nr:hypothetical protein [Planctomycetota bacterium]